MNTNRQNEIKSLLKASDISQRLNISKAYAYKLMQQGRIKTVQIGRSKRVRPSDLEDFIRDNTN